MDQPEFLTSVCSHIVSDASPSRASPSLPVRPCPSPPQPPLFRLPLSRPRRVSHPFSLSLSLLDYKRQEPAGSSITRDTSRRQIDGLCRTSADPPGINELANDADPLISRPSRLASFPRLFASSRASVPREIFARRGEACQPRTPIIAREGEAEGQLAWPRNWSRHRSAASFVKRLSGPTVTRGLA